MQFLSKHTLNMVFKLFHSCSVLAVLLFISNSRCQAVSKDCDLVKCINSVKDYLIDLRSSKALNCKSLNSSATSWCSDSCMHKYFPENFKTASTGTHNFMEYCGRNLSNYTNANWSCISQHFFELLTCYMNISSATTNDVRENMLSKQLCRKSLDYSKCPSQVLLSECGSQSVKVMIDLFDFVSKYFRFPSCDEAVKMEASSMPVHYNFLPEHTAVAKCFDKHPNFAGNCFGQLIQDETDLHNYLCGENDQINSCVKFLFNEYGKGCKSVADISHILLPKLFLFSGIKCKPNFELQDSITQHHSTFKGQKPTSYEIHPNSYLHDDGNLNTKDETHANPNNETHEASSKDEIYDAEEFSDDLSYQSWATSTSEPLSNVHTSSRTDSDSTLKMAVNIGKTNKNETELLKTVGSNSVDINYLKTSSGTYLNCDRISFAIIYLIVITLSIFHLLSEWMI